MGHICFAVRGLPKQTVMVLTLASPPQTTPRATLRTGTSHTKFHAMYMGEDLDTPFYRNLHP